MFGWMPFNGPPSPPSLANQSGWGALSLPDIQQQLLQLQQSSLTSGGASQHFPVPSLGNAAAGAASQQFNQGIAAFGLGGLGASIASGPSPPHRPWCGKSEAIVAGEIIAWRAWHLYDGALRSVATTYAWEPQQIVEGDVLGGYGIHAYKDPLSPVADGYVRIAGQVTGEDTPWVIGQVALWGDVIEHKDGYRGQYGRVHDLVSWSRLVPDGTRKILKAAYLPRQTAVKAD